MSKVSNDDESTLGFDVVELVPCAGLPGEINLKFAVREVAFRINAWTPTEAASLTKKFLADEPIPEIAVALGRTLHATRTKIYELGLRRNSSRPWAEMEDRILVDEYGTIACATLAAMVGRTVAAVFARASSLGLTEGIAPPWSPWEDAQLVAGYAGGVLVVHLAALIGRPPSGVSSRAHFLGLKHKNWAPDWSEAEKSLAIEMAELGHTAGQIGLAFQKHGFPLRTKSGVGPMLQALGFQRSWGRPWIPEEIDALRRVYADSGSVAKLACRLGRSRSSVMWKAGTLELSGTHANAGRGFLQGDDWTDIEIATLRIRYGTEKVKDTAAALKRPLRAVYCKAHELGLSANYHRDWTADEDRAIGIAYSAGISMTDLAGAVGRDVATVSKRAIALGISFKDRTVAAPRGRRSERIQLTLQDILDLAVDLEVAIVQPGRKRRGRAPTATPQTTPLARPLKIVQRPPTT